MNSSGAATGSLLAVLHRPGLEVVLDPRANAGLIPTLEPWSRAEPVRPLRLWVGPEGGSNDQEAGDLTARGVQAARLGPHILRIETAASVVLRDTIQQHMANFAYVIRTDRAANAGVVAAYVDGLAGALALTIAGGHGSRTEVIDMTIKVLRDAIDRDLRHLVRI